MNWSPAPIAEVPPGVVTVTSTAPAACAGAVAVIWVAESTVKVDALLVPNFTPDAAQLGAVPEKSVPVITTEVPPAVEPSTGLTPVTVGVGVYVNRSPAPAAEVPDPFVAVMSTVVFTVPAGAVAVIDVAEFTVKLVAFVTPNFTAVIAEKLVPAIATDVPPPGTPATGVTDVTVGSAV